MATRKKEEPSAPQSKELSHARLCGSISGMTMDATRAKERVALLRGRCVFITANADKEITAKERGLLHTITEQCDEWLESFESVIAIASAIDERVNQRPAYKEPDLG